MSNTPHELGDEFPGKTDLIHEMKATDPHFAALADRYYEANRAVRRAETDLEPTDDLHMAELRKERMALKDQIAAALRAAQST